MILTDHAQPFNSLAHDWIVKGDRQVTFCDADLNWPRAQFPLKPKDDAMPTCATCLHLRTMREKREIKR